MTSELRPEIDVAADVIEANRPGAVLKGIAVIKAYGDDREAKGREEQAAELAKWKALAETLAGALGLAANRLERNAVDYIAAGDPHSYEQSEWADEACQALTSYKEQRDAS